MCVYLWHNTKYIWSLSLVLDTELLNPLELPERKEHLLF